MRPSVLALHGFSSGPSSFDVLRGEAYEVIAPALLGHGAATTSARFDEEVERLCALADALAPPRILLGYSLGGRLALAMLARGEPRFVRAIVIGAGIGLEDEHARAARREADATLARTLRDEGVEAFFTRWEAQPLFATQASLPVAPREARRALRRAYDAEGLARALEVLGLAEMPYLGEALRDVTTPIDYLAGEHDTKFTSLGRALEASAPSVRLHIVEGAGHDVLLERPEAVRACLRAALDEATRGSA